MSTHCFTEPQGPPCAAARWRKEFLFTAGLETVRQIRRAQDKLRAANAAGDTRRETRALRDDLRALEWTRYSLFRAARIVEGLLALDGSRNSVRDWKAYVD